jgi:nucleoside-specific outer membrane channel protein Tsx
MMKRFTRSTLARTVKTLILAALLAAPVAVVNDAHAGAAVWQSTNFQYIWGAGFRNPTFGANGPVQDVNGHVASTKDSNRSTITVEHADAWKYGDNFFFFDITNGEFTRRGTDKKTSIYGELSPRLSLGKISGQDLSYLFVKDLLLAGTLEVDGGAGGGFHNYLYGLGFSLNLPKFNFADLNVYVRNDTNQSGVTYQITPVWQVPFTVGKADFVFEGFSDIAGPEGDLSFNIDFQPRLLLDLGKVWDKPGNLYFGTELMIWHNKFGFKGVNEFAPQAMLKWVL